MLRINKLLSLLLLLTCGSILAQDPGQQQILAPSMVSGNVYDAATGAPVEGVSVVIPGSGATFTDSAGAFSIDVPSYMATLEIGGLGYQTNHVALRGRKVVKAYLYPEGYNSLNQDVDEYYMQRPYAYTPASVVTINVKDENWKQTGTSAETIFKGELPGLNVIKRSGVPGSGSNMFLRGYTSLYATNQPLIVIDGMIYDNKEYEGSVIPGYATNPLAFIDLNDVDDITLIKDGTSSIYGGRSANGVIMIRTNHASKMATNIDVTGYGGINYSPDNQIPLLGADDYRIYLSEMLQSKGLTSDSLARLPFLSTDMNNPSYYRYHNYTNWQNDIFRNSKIQGYNMKIRGGDDVALYALSIGYLNHEGIVKNTDYNRYSVRFNSDINVSSKLTVNSNISLVYNLHNLSPEGNNEKTINPINLSWRKAPFMYPRVVSSTGAISPILEDADVLGVSNPVAIVQNMDATSSNYRIFGSVNPNYQLSRNFVVSDLIGFTFDKIRENLFVPHLGVANDTISSGVVENMMGEMVERIFSLTNDLRVKYTRSFNLSHNLTAIGGIRNAVNKVQGDWGYGYNSPNDQSHSVGTGLPSMRTVNGYLGDWNWLTFYAKGSYNFQNRYFIDVNLALDGSSRYGQDANGVSLFSNKFGFFPSVAAAWLLSSEKFMSGADFINLLKLRISYGITGNDDIGNKSALRYYTSQNFLGAEGIVPGNLANTSLQWETVKKADAGIDLSVARERVNLTLDVYSNQTDNLLNFLPADQLTGFDSYLTNEGSFKSTGFDAGLNIRIVNGANFKWDVGATLSKYKTEITSFPGGAEGRITSIMGANILTRVGEPVGVFYGYKALGVFSTRKEAEASGLRALMPNTDLVPFSAGDVHFQDVNNDKVIDQQDMQIIGDPNPDMIGMFSSALSWKGLSLDAAFTFKYGGNVFNQVRYTLESMQNTDNQTPVVLNRWRSEGQVTDIPKAQWGDPIGNARFSDRWIEDGSYIRLKSITLSYKLPVMPQFINGLQIFVTGQNLFTWTNYLGMDPEFSFSETSLSQGIDIGLTPQPRSVSAGVRIGL